MLDYAGPPTGAAANDIDDDDYNGGTVGGVGSPASLRADLLSLPEEGGGFRVGDFVGPELGAFCRAEPAALEDLFIAELAASLVHSGVRLDDEEYVKVLKRLLEVGMLEFTATASEYPLKLFAVWKVVGNSAAHHGWTGAELFLPYAEYGAHIWGRPGADAGSRRSFAGGGKE